MTPLSPQLSHLRELAEESGRIAQECRKSLKRELKPDGSIVTNGDRTVEEFLRKELPALAPSSTVWGEEFGKEEEGAGGLWVVDPVDGTSNYAFGGPYWGVSIGLTRGSEILLGAIFLPDIGEMYLAEKGGGVTLNGSPVAPIPAGAVEPFELVSYCETVRRRLPDGSIPGRMRCTGAFVVDGTFTCLQRFRGLIGCHERLYDVAPSVLMGLELGADVRYVDGDPFDVADLKVHAEIAKPWIIFPANSGFLVR